VPAAVVVGPMLGVEQPFEVNGVHLSDYSACDKLADLGVVGGVAVVEGDADRSAVLHRASARRSCGRTRYAYRWEPDCGCTSQPGSYWKSPSAPDSYHKRPPRHWCPGTVWRLLRRTYGPDLRSRLGHIAFFPCRSSRSYTVCPKVYVLKERLSLAECRQKLSFFVD
jgi:hypothetical protein